MRLPGSIRKRFGGSGRDGIFFLLSLLLAFGIWLIHNLSLDYTKMVSVPVIAQSNLDGHARRSSNPVIIMARCRTRGIDLFRLQRSSESNPLVVEFLPGDLHPKGGELFYATASDLTRYVSVLFGDQAQLEAFVSDTLVFRFPFENSKKVPVHPVCNLSYKSQYDSPSGLRMSPDSVYVYGEPYLLDNLDRVYTEAFSLFDLAGPVHGEVSLEQVKGVRFSHDKAEYLVDVQRYVEISAELPVKAVNVPRGKTLRIYPSKAQVSFRCAFPVRINPANCVTLRIDYKDFAGSLSGACIPELRNVPDGVFSYSIQPPVFECVETR